MHKTLLNSISAIGLIGAWSAPALAQDAATPAASQPVDGVQLAALQTDPAPAASSVDAPAAAANQAAADTGTDIIVTAQKREENINKVGLSITAVGSQALQERNIQSLADIAKTVPGLSYVNSANNTPVYNLRGVGFYDTSLGSYPTTSVYVDQVPLPFPVLTNLTAFDLERIEVLKGPQGTLFGQNSTGGAINYIANKPTSTFKAGVQGTYGRFNHFIGEGYVSGPLAGTVRARLAGRIERSGNWQKSYTRDDENGKAKNYAARLLVDWNPTDRLKFELNLNAWRDQDDPQAVAYSRFNLQFQPNPPFGQLTNVSPAVQNYPFAPKKARLADWSEENDMYRDLKFKQAALRADWELIDDITLTSITSLIRFKQKGALDQDGINFQDIDLRAYWGKINSFSQELRIANSGTGPVKWIVGANYSKDHVFYRENIVYGDGSGGNNQAPPFQIESSENFSDQDMKNYAVFGNVEWQVNDVVSLKAGARYTKAKRKADICNLDGSLTPRGGPANRNFPVGGVNRLFDLLADLFAPGNTYPDIQPGECFNLNDPDPLNVNQNNLGPWQPGLFTASLNEDNISWRLGMDLKPTDNLLLFFNYAKGYKAGGFGNINAAIDFQFRPVVQESILNYEAGFKAQMLDRKVSVNGAVFYMDYKDKQLRTKDVNPIFGIIDALNNIPKSHIMGAELELQARPVRGLSLGAAGTYIKSRIDEYIGLNAGGVLADFKGSEIPFTPKWQLGANARYEFPVADSLKAFLAGQVNYRSETSAAVGRGLKGDVRPGPLVNIQKLDAGFTLKAYTTVDAQVGVKGDNWRAFLWGKNLTNSYYWTNVVAGQDQFVRYVQKPRTYGVTVGYDF